MSFVVMGAPLGHARRQWQHRLGPVECLDLAMVTKTAKVLDVPESFFYAVGDESAWLLIGFHRLPGEARGRALQSAPDAADE